MKFLLLSISLLLFFPESKAQNWRTADRSPLGIAPLPQDEPRAIVQVYVARAFAWRGYFAVHPWIAVKEANASQYDVYEVVGFRRTEGVQMVRKTDRAPDSRWFGNDPEMIFDLRGSEAEKMIPLVLESIASYPYQDSYRLYPGPNSNTFVSHVIRHTPGMTVELPPHAIGKDWIDDGDLVGWSESKTGIQVSLFGLLGFTIGAGEGIEINLFGMTFGIDILRPALKLPFIGRLGFKDGPVPWAPDSDEGSSEAVAKPPTSASLH